MRTKMEIKCVCQLGVNTQYSPGLPPAHLLNVSSVGEEWVDINTRVAQKALSVKVLQTLPHSHGSLLDSLHITAALTEVYYFLCNGKPNQQTGLN